MQLKRVVSSTFLQRLLRSPRNDYTVQSDKIVKPDNEISKHLRLKIQTKGPITVAEYMKDVLINPSTGYYMHKNVFGQSGDFVTSPELGQTFGEMIAIWFINEWSKAGGPKPVQIVELGPGTGTLCEDILRVFTHFRILEDASVHLVEVSPYLSKLQAKRLCLPSDINITAVHKNMDNSVCYQEYKTPSGIPVFWYRHLDDVPNAFTLLIAHEFFDALPIHKFQKTERGYREVLIDIDSLKENSFRYVIANNETPIGKLLIKSDETRPHLEVSPESLVLVQKIASRLNSDGGLALIADYGHDGLGTDTFRAFKKHKLHDPLIDPGSADLTADVDFSALKKVAIEKKEVLAFGPISQRDFLLNMGIEYRLSKLKEGARKEQLESLEYSFNMMTDPDKMGHRFKFLALVPAVLEKILKRYPITGF